MADDSYAICTAITIGSTNNKLYLKNKAGTPITVTITSGSYADILALCTQIQSDINGAAGIVDTFEVKPVWDATLKASVVKITDSSCSGGDTFELTCTSTTNAVWATIGYSTAADRTGAAYYYGDYQHTCGWYNGRGPALDTYDRFEMIAAEPFITNSAKAHRVSNPARFNKRVINLVGIPSTKIVTSEATGSLVNQDLWTTWTLIAKTTKFNLYYDYDMAAYEAFPATASLEGTYQLVEPIDNLGDEILRKTANYLSYYELDMVMEKDPSNG